MQLYHETIQVPTSISSCVNGNFTGNSRKKEEIVIVRGSTFLELLRPDTQTTGRFTSLCITNTFSIIRSLAVFSFPPNEPNAMDHLAISSDSGCLVVLKFDKDKGEWERLFCEAFGKSGLKRGIPGQFLAADPSGRALMISALERAKLAYFFHKFDSDEPWKLSSPIEVNKNKSLTEALVALDSGNDNPLFAALESTLCDEKDEGQTAEKRLVFYEVQTGLNAVSRKTTQKIDFESNFLFPVASGVIVATEQNIYFCRPFMEPLQIRLPQRQPTSGYSHRPAIITSATCITVKDIPFILLQNEFGDLFRVDLAENNIQVRYFDSIPAGRSLLLLKSGFLFLAAESTDHCLFQLEDLGDDEPIASDFFEPRPLQNLVCVSTLVNYGSIANAHIQSNGEIFSLKGRGMGNSPFLEILKSSVMIKPDSQVALEREYSRLFQLNGELIVSGPKGAFNITTQEPVKILLAIGKLANGYIVRVHGDSVSVFEHSQEKFQWMPPARSFITKATLNERQLVVLLNQSLLVYFELDESGLLLREHSKTLDLDAEVTSLALSPVPLGLRRGLLLCIGTKDSLLHLLSLKPESFLEELASQVCASTPTSVFIIEESLHVGLENGVYVKMRVDVVTGALSDPESRLLGPNLLIGVLNGLMAFEEDQVPFSHIYANDSLGSLWFEVNKSLMRVEGISKVQAIVLEGEEYSALGQKELFKFRLPPINDAKYSVERIPLSFTGTKIAFDEESGLYLVVEGEPVPSLATDVPLWNSAVRIWNHKKREFIATIPMMDNEAVTCAVFVRFASRPGVMYLAVGAARDFQLIPRQASLGAIILYMVQTDGTKPQFIHRTEFLPSEELLLIPSALSQFSGRLLCGVGGYLRLYDFGKLKLLLKCSINLPTFAVSVSHQGLRVVVADARASLLIFYYRPDDNRFYLVADEPTCRPPTNSLLALDYDTWAIGDRVGGLALLQLPRNLSQELDTDPASSRLNQSPAYFAAPLKLELLAYLHIGSPVIGLGKVEAMYGRSALRYITVDGGQGILAPFITKNQADNVNTVVKEVSLRERASLTGRNHAWFRAMYYPAPNVIDGDLLTKQQILDPTVKQVLSTIKSIYTQ